MKKSILFSLLVFSTALALVGCKFNPNEPEAGGSYSGKSNGHEYVDLGLSVKWAACNVGATTPQGYGYYFAWGETTTKSTYNWSTYSDRILTKYKNELGGKTVLDPEDDAAHVNWGGSWRIPTLAEWQELLDNCTWTWTTQNGINGYMVTSNKAGYTDKFIFLPAAGYRDDGDLDNVGSYGNYWSPSYFWASLIEYFAGDLYFNSDGRIISYKGRFCGLSVRPVLP